MKAKSRRETRGELGGKGRKRARGRVVIDFS